MPKHVGVDREWHHRPCQKGHISRYFLDLAKSDVFGHKKELRQEVSDDLGWNGVLLRGYRYSALDVIVPPYIILHREDNMPRHGGNWVSYLRVSTDRQGQSGLGLEAQRKAVLDFLNGGQWKLAEEFAEVESGKRNNRPQLAAALAACKRLKARLVVAKLDRLARNVAFISKLMESGLLPPICHLRTSSHFTFWRLWQSTNARQ